MPLFMLQVEIKMLLSYFLNNIYQGRTLKPSSGKIGSLEETAEAVSINSLICKRV